MGDGPFMRGFASCESIKGGTADQGICPLSEGQIPFFVEVGRKTLEGVGEGTIATNWKARKKWARGAVRNRPRKD